MSLGASGISVVALVVALVLSACAAPPVAGAPAPIVTTTARPAATPTASATPSPATGRYLSPLLGYSIETPPPWHRSSCSSVVTQQSPTPGGEVFVPVSTLDESGTDIGSPYWTLTVKVDANPQNLTPRKWAEQLRTGTAGQRLEDVVYADRPAARKVYPGELPGPYFVANGGRMYTVDPDTYRPAPDAATQQAMLRMIASFRFISDAESAAARAALPTQAPPRTPEQVADGVAAAFAAKDADAVAGFLPPCVATAAEQAMVLTVSREKYMSGLRAGFASGLVVTVRPRPFETVTWSNMPLLGATWQDARGSRERKLMLRRGENDRWEVEGTLCRCDITGVGSY